MTIEEMIQSLIRNELLALEERLNKRIDRLETNKNHNPVIKIETAMDITESGRATITKHVKEPNDFSYKEGSVYKIITNKYLDYLEQKAKEE